jgi:hypothetical protein
MRLLQQVSAITTSHLQGELDLQRTQGVKIKFRRQLKVQRTHKISGRVGVQEGSCII